MGCDTRKETVDGLEHDPIIRLLLLILVCLAQTMCLPCCLRFYPLKPCAYCAGWGLCCWNHQPDVLFRVYNATQTLLLLCCLEFKPLKPCACFADRGLCHSNYVPVALFGDYAAQTIWLWCCFGLYALILCVSCAPCVFMPPKPCGQHCHNFNRIIQTVHAPMVRMVSENQC